MSERLTAEQVEYCRRHRSTIVWVDDEPRSLCDSHEALRADLAARTVERDDWQRKADCPMILCPFEARIAETVKMLQDERTQTLSANVEGFCDRVLARLARERT